MPHGPALTFFEVFGRFQHTNPLYKNSLIACLEGEVKVTILDDEVILKPREVIGYDYPHNPFIEPATPLAPNSRPATIIWIGGNRLGKVPDLDANLKQIRVKKLRVRP